MAERALVLGAGGMTAIAWEVGVLAGLAAHGIDLTAADLVIGTSAGAVVGVQVTSGASLRELYAAQLAAPGAPPIRRMSLAGKARFAWAVSTTRDPVVARQRLGRQGLATPSMPESERRAVFAARVPSLNWPRRDLLLTAVDIDSGDLGTFGPASKLPLIDALMASCALPGVWRPVPLMGRQWMDGSARSSTNADLAEGCRRVVVLAPVSRGLGTLPRAASHVDTLRRQGRAAVLVAPGHRSIAALGRGMLWGAPGARAAAARAGYAEGASTAAPIRPVWDP